MAESRGEAGIGHVEVERLTFMAIQGNNRRWS